MNFSKCILPVPRTLHSPAKGLQLAIFLTPFQNKPATVRTVTRHTPPPENSPVWFPPCTWLQLNVRIRPPTCSLSYSGPISAAYQCARQPEPTISRDIWKDICIQCAGLDRDKIVDSLLAMSWAHGSAWPCHMAKNKRAKGPSVEAAEVAYCVSRYSLPVGA